MSGHAAPWQAEMQRLLQDQETASVLRATALDGQLKEWTAAMTSLTVRSFKAMGWSASAKGHRLDRLPVQRSEYLSLDVIALSGQGSGWRFPVAVAELENSQQDDIVAYALWKVLCVKAQLRVVFCYRETEEGAGQIVGHLRDAVIGALPAGMLVGIEEDVVVVVGTRGEADAFPYGFFKWWMLEPNVRTFKVM